jgi:hypothetical protein
LEDIGLEGRRIQMINVSSAMGGQFAWSAAELTEEIRQMGPSPLQKANDTSQNKDADINTHTDALVTPDQSGDTLSTENN